MIPAPPSRIPGVTSTSPENKGNKERKRRTPGKQPDRSKQSEEDKRNQEVLDENVQLFLERQIEEKRKKKEEEQASKKPRSDTNLNKLGFLQLPEQKRKKTTTTRSIKYLRNNPKQRAIKAIQQNEKLHLERLKNQLTINQKILKEEVTKINSELNQLGGPKEKELLSAKLKRKKLEEDKISLQHEIDVIKSELFELSMLKENNELY